MFRRPKACQIIPIEEYDGIPIIFEDDKWRYKLGPTGHFTRLRKKTCFLCGQSARFVCIFDYSGHQSIERFCPEHTSNYGELPKQDPQQELKLTNKQKLAIQKWTSIKVNT